MTITKIVGDEATCQWTDLSEGESEGVFILPSLEKVPASYRFDASKRDLPIR